MIATVEPKSLGTGPLGGEVGEEGDVLRLHEHALGGRAVGAVQLDAAE